MIGMVLETQPKIQKQDPPSESESTSQRELDGLILIGGEIQDPGNHVPRTCTLSVVVPAAE